MGIREGKAYSLMCAYNRIAGSPACASDMLERHGSHYLDFAVEAEPHLVAEDQVGWLDRCDVEHRNIREALRWAIETGFETMHAWGQDRFMVRSWTAIDRLLWVLAAAYALVVLARHDRALRCFRVQAEAVLKQLSVLGDHLTVGKLAEAIGLDFARHARAWLSAWLT